MPPRRRPTGPTPVDSIRHDGERRANLPTSDAQEFVTPEIEQARRILVDRDTALDPQLVWRGKYGDESPEAIEAAGMLGADAPPIYIQEKIDPRVLVENLRRTAARPEEEPELALFDTFDDLDELDQIEFYRHSSKWTNRMILGDSLQVMGSLAEREELRGQVQMVYLDPPYGIKFGSNWQASARKRDVKDGKLEDAAREAEQIKAFRDTWELGIHSYLSYLRDRLLVARELLTESGSCFVQIGQQNVHLVRSVLDEVFGPEQFVSQISVRKTATPSGKLDDAFFYLLWYARDSDAIKYRQLWLQRDARAWFKNTPGGSWGIECDGVRRPTTPEEKQDPRTLPGDARLYALSKLNSAGPSQNPQDFSWRGRVFNPGARNHWKTSLQGLAKLDLANRLEDRGGPPWFVRFHDDNPQIPLTNLFEGTAGKSEEAIYVVQTQPDVIERCMLMCTDPGDLVLDPTCGSGTTAYVAEQWGRRWITIDTSRVALALARQRLMGAKFPYYLLADSKAGREAEARATGRALPPSPTSDDIRHGFVYERVPHVTLKSIANNPDIVEGMTREEIDAAIARHADVELLYDKPYEDKHKVRVTGPFTVESLSPHRSLAFAGGADDRETVSEHLGAAQPDAPTFEQSILDNLQRAGVQNGRKSERIEFDTVEPYPGTYVQAIGVTSDGSRVGVAIGPQYGTVSQRFARDAVGEAVRADDIDLLCLLGFAFDATTAEVTEADGVTVDTSSQGFAEVAGERSFGRIKLLFVRMNADLLMGEDLKKTGAGNLFTVFGEPDIDVRTIDAGPDQRMVEVELNGIDVFDPTTGEVRSDDTGRVALWMIDSDYNGDSFFVRHCYFTGGNKPYQRLQTALKAEIDPDAWASLYGTVSRPFPAPSTGRIAVKVINDYGDEVMKVFEVSDS